MIDLSLSRIERLLEALGSPHRRLPPTIHVAGTNGKGSTVAFMRAVLEAAGRRVHVYTSPHLLRINERIRLGDRPHGRLIEDEVLLELLTSCERCGEDLPLSFFEALTAAAFCAFAAHPADALLLETGLGGRADATNVISSPRLCVISAIGLDHQAFLGETIAAIAAEKAGIVKPGAVLVHAAERADVAAILDARAAATGASVYRGGREWSVRFDASGAFRFCDRRDGAAQEIALPKPNPAGEFQGDNAALAVAALRRFDPSLSASALAQGLRDAVWPGRLQAIESGRIMSFLGASAMRVWLDGGHNPAAAHRLAVFFRRRAGADAVLGLICAMLDDKDAQGWFAAFSEAGLRFEGVAASPPQIDADDASRRFYDAESLAAIAASCGHDIVPAGGDFDETLRRLRPRRNGDLLIGGSLYFVGEVLRWNRSEEPPAKPIRR